MATRAIAIPAPMIWTRPVTWETLRAAVQEAIENVLAAISNAG